MSKHRHSVVYEIVVSPDGKSIAFAAWKDSRRLLYRDGEIVPTGYDAVDSFAFAPDGKSIAYFATKKKGEDEEELFLVHGDQATRLEGTGGAGILFKRDGTLAAYAFEDPDWKYRVVHGGKQVGEPCTWVQDMVLGPDERTLTYCAENAEETRAVVVRNGRTMGGPYDSRSVKALFRAPDGPALAFLAKVEGKWVLVRDGKAITSRFDDVTEIVRSADGRRLVFGARQGGIVHRIRMSW